MGKQLWKPGNMLYPLPVVMVSLADRDGRPNIITLAWVGTVCTNPPMVSISVRPERYSYPILKESRRIRDQSDHEGAGICHRLLWREKRTGRG